MNGLSFASLDSNPSLRAHQLPVQVVLEFLSDGTSLARRFGEPVALPLLVDLAYAIAEIGRGVRSRAVVRIPIDKAAWELGLERHGDGVSLSVFSGGPVPEVGLQDRRIDGLGLGSKVLEGLDALAATDAFGDSLAIDARSYLASSLPFPSELPPPTVRTVPVEASGSSALKFSAELALKESTGGGAPMSADLLGLLFRGRFAWQAGRTSRELPDVCVFLLAEQLVGIVHEGLEASMEGRPMYRRIPVGGAICGLRTAPRAPASLILGLQRKAGEERGDTCTLPDLDLNALAQATLTFGRALVRALVRQDRGFSSNLRVVGLRERLRELSDHLRAANRSDAKVNDAPEGYRAYAVGTRASKATQESVTTARLRYSPKWLATVPSIDLRSTFLCGEILVVGAARETCAFDRRTGELFWRQAMPKAVSIVTPAGLARLDSEGVVALHDFGTGHLTFTSRLAPRVGGSTSGAVINAPGLPRLLVVSEGLKRLAALDLDSGDVRWRFNAKKAGTFRVRRAGKLLLVASGDAALTALDVASGEVVWRFCDALGFSNHVVTDQDSLFAMAGGASVASRAGSRLHHLDPWTGELRHSWDLPAGIVTVGAPMLAGDTVVLMTGGKSGTTLVGVDRRSGELRFHQAVASGEASCLVVDDLILANTDTGELLAIDALDGSTRYRHRFAGPDGDKPRRLEPVLRSGALFVPQTEVHIVRPRDGTVLGKIETDLIPDLLRVDERCDVYAAEESGHLAAFAAGPRLQLVR